MGVTVSDVAATLGRSLTSAESAQATLWINDARTVISHGPDGRSSLTLDALDQPTLDLVVREAVANRLKRPDSATQVSISVDDGQVSKRYESTSGQIEILPRWWVMLLPDADSGAFSIRPVGDSSPAPASLPSWLGESCDW